MRCSFEIVSAIDSLSSSPRLSTATISCLLQYDNTHRSPSAGRFVSESPSVARSLSWIAWIRDPPTERWPVYPTFDQRTLAEVLQEELIDRGKRPAMVDERREEYTRDILVALDEDIWPPSITADGARSILQRLSEDAEIDIDHPKHDYLAPHGGRRGVGEVLIRGIRVHGCRPISR